MGKRLGNHGNQQNVGHLEQRTNGVLIKVKESLVIHPEEIMRAELLGSTVYLYLRGQSMCLMVFDGDGRLWAAIKEHAA